jgi:hypothetical protein
LYIDTETASLAPRVVPVIVKGTFKDTSTGSWIVRRYNPGGGSNGGYRGAVSISKSMKPEDRY